MVRTLTTYLIRKKNPFFSFHPSVTDSVILGLLLNKAISFIRGLKIIFLFRAPALLFLGRGVRFFNISKIRFGKYTQLGDYVYLNALGKQGIRMGSNVSVGAFSRLVVSTSFNNPGEGIRIGNNVGIGEYSYLGGGGGLIIGDDCIIGQYLSCHPENHCYDTNGKPIRLQGVTRKGIVIGRNCWIGARVTILDGVVIGDNCVIAAGSVVNKSIPSNAVIAGVPAKIIKVREDHMVPVVLDESAAFFS